MHHICFIVYVYSMYLFLSAYILEDQEHETLRCWFDSNSLAHLSFSSHAIAVLYSHISNNFHTCMFGCSSVGLLRSQPMDFFRQQIGGGIRASAGARVRRSSDSCSEGG